MKGSVEERREKILNGNIIKILLSLAWPVVIGSMMQTAYNLADTFWLGRVSQQALAAPSAAFPLVMVLMALGMGLATAGISLVSQHTGSGGDKRANEAAGQVFGLLFIISVIGGVIGFFSAGWVLSNVMTTPTEVFPLARNYIQIIFLGAPIMFSFISFRFILRGTGDMKTPMYLRGVGVVLNMILDPLLILGIGPFPPLGVSGAAIATVSTRGVASVVAIYLLFGGKLDIKLSLKDLKLKLRWVKKIFDIGLPSSAARVGSSIGFLGLVVLINRLSGPAGIPLSAYSVGRRVIQMVNLGIWGFASASMTMVGQNIGAKQKKRAEEIVKKTLMVSGILMTIITVFIFLIRGSFVGIFLDKGSIENYQAVLDEASRFVAIFVASIPFFGFFRIFDSTYRGTGHTKPAMALSLTRILGLRIGLSYILAFPVYGFGLDLGVLGIWLGMSLSNIIIAFVSYLYFRTGKWKERTIEKEDETQNLAAG
ncbi:MAG: MATE family efflux transporter [Candidatus Thermoplasmatota archaeon]